MTKSDQDPPATEDIDIRALGRAVWRAKGWILGLAVGAGALTFIVLSMLRPLYTSEARILIQDDASTVTQRALDAQAVQSQVQAITSRDLAVEVIKALDLTNNPAFAEDAGASAVGRLLRSLGLGRGAERSEEDKAVNTFAEHLSVFPLAKSSVVAIDYTSGDSGLAAQIANKLADVYIAWQRQAALEQTKDATAWLNAQIEVLRPKVAEAEAAVRAIQGERLERGRDQAPRARGRGEGRARSSGVLSRPLSRCERPPRHGRGAGASGHRQPGACLDPALLPAARTDQPARRRRHRSALARLRAAARADWLTGGAAPGDRGKRPPPAGAPRNRAAPPRQPAPPEPAAPQPRRGRAGDMEAVSGGRR